MLADRRHDRGLLIDRPGPQRCGDDRRALAQQQPQVELRARAPLQPDHHEPPVCRERLDVAREVLRAHVVQDDIGSRTAPARTSLTVLGCRCPDRGDEVLVPIVDEHLGAERTAYVELLGRPGSDGDVCANGAGQLDGHRPDPRRTTVDEQPLSGRQPRRHEDVRPHGAGHLGQRRRVHERHARRHRQQLACGDGDAGGIPAAGEQRAGLVANGPTGDVRAHRRHSSAALEPQVCRCARWRGIVPLPLEQVCAVDTGSDDVQDHLVGAWGGVGDLGKGERLGASGCGHGDGQHDSERSRDHPAGKSGRSAEGPAAQPGSV